MNRLSNPPPHRYTGAGFDRAAHRRLDADWLSARRADPQSRVLLMSGLEVLVSTRRSAAHGDPDGRATGRAAARGCPVSSARRTAPRCSPPISAGPRRASGRFAEVRAVGAWLPAKEAGWCAYARGARVLAQPPPLLRRVRRRHGQRCRAATSGAVRSATPSTSRAATRRSSCSSPIATRSTASAVCSAARRAFPPACTRRSPGSSSPANSLEETVRREVYEEAGVEVVDMQYRSSQPWPFPASLMLGFRATARSDELRIDPDELVDAGWYSRAQLIDPEQPPGPAAEPRLRSPAT